MKQVTKSDTQKITNRKSLRYFEYVMKTYTTLTPDEEFNLVTKIQNGELSLMNNLFYHNIRFVVVVCKSMNSREHKISFDDVFSSGLRGLWYAVQKVADKTYDPTRGFRFISYAVKCIQGFCLSDMKLFDTHMHIPSNIQQCLLRMRRAADKVFVEEGINWSDALTEEYMLSEFTERTTSIVMYNDSQRNISLTSTIGVYTDSDTLVEFETSAESRAGDNYWLPDNGSIRDDFHITLRSIFKNDFYEREVQVLVAYFGLWSLEEYAIHHETDEPMQLEDIGEYMGITRERIRQIKDKAITKLRSNSRSSLLRDFLALPLNSVSAS